MAKSSHVATRPSAEPTSQALEPKPPHVRHRSRGTRAVPCSTNEGVEKGQRTIPVTGPAADAQSSAATKTHYEVGYGRPPRHTQFQRGQSGNPRGRPKKSKNTRTIAREELEASLTFHVNGKTKTAPAKAIIIKQLVKKAVEKGDIKAFFALLALAGESHSPSPEQEGEASPAEAILTDAEKEIIAFAQRDVLAQAGVPEDAIDRALTLMGLTQTVSTEPDGGPK